jgi:hypothetical protein
MVAAFWARMCLKWPMRVDLTKSVVDALACPEGKREILVVSRPVV